MRVHVEIGFALSAWLNIAALGCAEEEPGTPAVGGSLALEGSNSPQCTIERPQPSISLGLAAANAEGSIDLRLASAGTFTAIVGNSSSADSTVTIGAKSWSEGGESIITVASGRVAAGSTADIDVEARLLGLPEGSFERSGSLVLAAEARFEDGSIEESEPLTLGFHPEAGGWRIYDLATRDSSYWGGGLTPASRARREMALARLPRGVRLAATTGAATEGHAQGWTPPLDGPPDSDGGER